MKGSENSDFPKNNILICYFVKMMGSAASSRAMTPVPGQQQEGFSV
jgi:hypothetical protein